MSACMDTQYELLSCYSSRPSSSSSREHPGTDQDPIEEEAGSGRLRRMQAGAKTGGLRGKRARVAVVTFSAVVVCVVLRTVQGT